MNGPEDDLRPEAVARRRFLLGLGFVAGILALGRRLPRRVGGRTASEVAADSTTVSAVPRSTTSEMPPATTMDVVATAPPTTIDDHLYDLVVAGGRVIDPESGFDAVAFGTKFLAKPDLPARIAAGAALNDPKADLFYTGKVGNLTYTGPEGYTDYPPLTPN